MNVNINQIVRVKLTEKGRQIINIENSNFKMRFKKDKDFKVVHEDENGWSRWQLWDLMSMFGPYIFMGCIMPFETVIDITEDN